MTLGMLENPSGSFSARVWRSKSFLTSESIRVVLGSGFNINVSGAQNSSGVLGCGVVTNGKELSN